MTENPDCLVILPDNGENRLNSKEVNFACELYGGGNTYAIGRAPLVREPGWLGKMGFIHIFWAFKPLKREMAIVTLQLPDAVHTFLGGAYER